MLNQVIPVVIVEDEKRSVAILEWIIKTLFPARLELVGVFHNVPDAVAGIRRLQPGLVLLDVQLDGDDCFSLLEQLQPVNFEIIITTAHNQYMLKAVHWSAIDYLLKPISAPDFQAAMERLEKRLEKTSIAQQVAALIHNSRQPDWIPTRLAIPVIDGVELVDISDIAWCEGAGSYTLLHLVNNQKMTSSQQLAFFEDILTDCNFYRIHNSYLVNLDQVSKYVQGRGGHARMKNGNELEVAARRKDDFLKRIGKGRWW